MGVDYREISTISAENPQATNFATAGRASTSSSSSSRQSIGSTHEDQFDDEEGEPYQPEDSEIQRLDLSSRSGTSSTSSSRELPPNQQPQITWLDASMHLIKGNLGPGCLNLPHAFALSGWLLGNILFGFVVLQGIYSMILLAECKQVLQSQRFITPHGHPVSTFMDVAQISLGQKGHMFVQIFLFILQTGVCCVFLSLIATNLNAQAAGLSQNACIGLVTFALLGIVLVRYMKDLRWLSAIANTFMLVAITTAAVSGILQVFEDELPLPPKGTGDLGNVATFVSSMFFSFEGIGLVLPVENSFTFADTPQQIQEASSFYRNRVLPGAMLTVGFLFWFIGFFASWGFPDIENGSITAYLAERFPTQPWYTFVNSLVMVAVFLTFPLQLTPALEVLDEWCTPSINRNDGGRLVDTDDGDGNCQTSEELTSSAIERVDSSDGHRSNSLLESIENDFALPDNTMIFCAGWKKYEWIIPRYLVVFGCAVVVLLVDDLGLLMALFGAVGQTGLAMMPCLCHLSLQRQGISPKHRLKTFMDILTVFFATTVMLFGLIVSVEKIFAKMNSRGDN